MLSKKIDIGPKDWHDYISLSSDNVMQTCTNLFDCCDNVKLVTDLTNILIDQIAEIAELRIKELANEPTTLPD
jgi:hypothetical protein